MADKPKWAHPLASKAGRIERAAWTFKEGERKRLLVVDVIAFLEKQGVSQGEWQEALNQASGGAMVASALGDA